MVLRESPRATGRALGSGPHRREDEGHWLKPVLVGQFEFVEWTPDSHLRHSRFIALREDKDATGVGRESQTVEGRHPRIHGWPERHAARMGDQLPIIPHESLGADCCGCFMVRVREDYADIICDECDSVIRTIRVAEAENMLSELARTDAICLMRVRA
jgi:hypothetical protein